MKKITFADDDPGILDAVGMLLEMEGYQVRAISNGQHLLPSEEESLPDIFILDIWMSGFDGRELCKTLKKNELTKSIPVILISAGNDLKQSASESGADDFLAKPFEIDHLLQKIQFFLDTKPASA